MSEAKYRLAGFRAAATNKAMLHVNTIMLAALAAGARSVVVADIGEFNTADLMEVLYAPAQQPESQGFWLQFYDRTINSTSQEIRFDSEDLNEYRLAPFVAPNVQGRMLRSKGFSVKSFRPAYVKPKHAVDPSRSILRRAGERPGGELSPSERFDAIVADNLRIERQVIENRWDWLACRATVDGMVTIVDEDYPAVTVDFGRDPSLTSVNLGAAKWDQPTATVMADIQSKRVKTSSLSRGPVTRLIFGFDAWAAFTQDNHADVQKLLDSLRRGNTSDFNAAGLQTGSQVEFQGAIAGYAGGGRLELYTYNGLYEDADGNMIPYMDQGSVVGIGTAFKGIRCFGAIMDKKASLQAVDMFPKQWDQEDPSVSFTMTQSAPLMVPIVANGSFKMKVVGN